MVWVLIWKILLPPIRKQFGVYGGVLIVCWGTRWPSDFSLPSWPLNKLQGDRIIPLRATRSALCHLGRLPPSRFLLPAPKVIACALGHRMMPYFPTSWKPLGVRLIGVQTCSCHLWPRDHWDRNQHEQSLGRSRFAKGPALYRKGHRACFRRKDSSTGSASDQLCHF